MKKFSKNPNKFQKKFKQARIFVGLSGGVDSSVSAALLKKQGFDVTGVFIKAWYPDFMPCNWREERRDAMRVAAKLDIPFITLDLEKDYKKSVVDYMLNEYKTGRTPNPDVMCNKEIKFGSFLKWAIKSPPAGGGADYVATGHYSQIIEHRTSKSKKKNVPCFMLHVSRDFNKDQSYFLWTLKQEQLKHILFPVGNLTKTEVRKLAKKFGLPTSDKKDSQGLCFIGKIDFKEFLAHYIKPKRGNVLDISGKRIGYHDGAMFLTIGQRHGFNISNKKDNSKPLYIVKKNIKKNEIVVYQKDPEMEGKVGTTKAVLSDVNWVSDAPKENKIYKVRTRYRQKLIPARIYKLKNPSTGSGQVWYVEFNKAILDISPGQSLVVYDKFECVGGGLLNNF